MRTRSPRKNPFIVLRCLLAVFLLAAAPASQLRATGSNTPQFLPAMTYDSGGINPMSVAIADVNGDGKPDLLVANWCASDSSCANGSVAVLLGNGDGTFQAAVTYASGGAFAVSVAMADVNRDGKPDLLVANCGAISISTCGIGNGVVGILLGNGDGTFQPVVSYDTGGSYSLSVAATDLNGDGKPDLAVSNLFSDNVGVLLGNGDGTFQSAVTYDAGGQAIAVAIADVSGDGTPDLLVATRASGGAVGVLLGNGNGTFKPVVPYNSGGVVPVSVAVSDVNGDGKPDVVVTNNFASNVGVLLGNGDGTLQPVVTYGSGGVGAYSVAVADVNGDGKPDLVLANCAAAGAAGCGGPAEAVVGALLGNGDGTFQAVLTYGSGGFDTQSVAIADVNGDGRPDVVVGNVCADVSCNGNGSVGVLLNNASFCTTPPMITLSTIPTSLWPPNGKMVPVTVSGTITDTGCTVTSAAYAVTDEYGQVQPSGAVTLRAGGTYSFTVLLQASRLGTDLDGRLYTITVSASNNAGKTGSQAGSVIVPHDQGR
jgi:hypothetical protein